MFGRTASAPSVFAAANPATTIPRINAFTVGSVSAVDWLVAVPTGRILLRHLKLSAQALQFRFELVLRVGVLGIAINAPQLVRVVLSVEEFPVVVLGRVEVDELVPISHHAVVWPHMMRRGVFVILVVKT